MDLQLRGLRAVVTGGSAGIGAAIVRTLAAEGCDVAFCARDAARVEALLSGLRDEAGNARGAVQGACVDVCDEAAVARWFAQLGGFDIFVPNVSALSGDWRAAIDVDMRATVACTEAAVPYLMHSSHAAITYVGSKAGSLAAPNSAAYGAAKAAMAHYMKSLSARLLPQVRVNTVSPGDTLMPGGYWDRIRREEPAVFETVLARNPMGRLASAEEVARVVAFVSSPAAAFVAGANWYVDGGSAAHVQF